MKKSCAAFIGMMLVIGVLWGCNGKTEGTTGSASSKIIEPSMIITREDAKALTGVSFDGCTTREQPVVGLKLCVYDKDSGFLQVGITQSAFMERKNGNTPESIYETTKSAFKDAARIDGVGEDNFLAPPGLHILKDGYYLTVSLGPLSKDREKLRAAGMKAVENLEKQIKK